MDENNQPSTKWRNSLSHHLLLRFWLSLTVCLLISGIVQYQTLYQFLLKGQITNLQTQQNVVNQNQLKLWLTHKTTAPTSLPDLTQGVTLGLFSNNGQLQAVFHRQNQFAPKLSFPHEQQIRDFILKRRIPKNYYIFRNNKMSYLIAIQPIYSSPNTKLTLKQPLNSNVKNIKLLGYVVTGISLKPIDDILNHQTLVYLINALAVIVLGGLLVYYILKKPLEPLMKISKISEKISHGQYDLRIPDLNASSEIEHLRLALNSMLTTIEKALATETKAKDQMARFIADASHELRTPLTSIRGFLEILLKNETQDIQTLQSAHNTMLIETERLIQLTENLLALQAIADEASEEKQEHPQTSAQETLPNILPLLQSLAGKRSLAINSENLELPLKPSEFKQILYNLIHNAVQHTSDDGKISVSIFKNQNDILLQISDNGEGIPSKDLPHIFDRFYRGTRSRQKQKGKGAGLGLAIVHEIVGLRGGKIEVISEIGKGSTISIIFMQTT